MITRRVTEAWGTSVSSLTNIPMVFYFQTQKASVLFVENPVGTGLSYCETDDCYTNTTGEITEDLLALLKVVFRENPEFQVCLGTLFTLGRDNNDCQLTMKCIIVKIKNRLNTSYCTEKYV